MYTSSFAVVPFARITFPLSAFWIIKAAIPWYRFSSSAPVCVHGAIVKHEIGKCLIVNLCLRVVLHIPLFSFGNPLIVQFCKVPYFTVSSLIFGYLLLNSFDFKMNSGVSTPFTSTTTVSASFGHMMKSARYRIVVPSPS